MGIDSGGDFSNTYDGQIPFTHGLPSVLPDFDDAISRMLSSWCFARLGRFFGVDKSVGRN
jgi:hypothetical protein